MTRQGMKRIASLIGALFIIYMGVALVSESVPLFGRYQHYVIVSGSMEPSIDVNDIVIIDTRADFAEGDIIAFETSVEGEEVRVVHYLDASEEVDGETVYFTRSEAGGRDDWEIAAEDIIGVHRMQIPRLGVMFNFFSSAIGRVVFIMNVIGIIAIVKILKTPSKKLSRRDAHVQR